MALARESGCDVNGDGRDDANYSSHRGEMWIHLGTSGGIATTATRIVVTGEYHAGTGDLNGDGLADAIVALRSCTTTLAEVYFGTTSGLSTSPSQTLMWPPHDDTCPTRLARPYVASAALSGPTH